MMLTFNRKGRQEFAKVAKKIFYCLIDLAYFTQSFSPSLIPKYGGLVCPLWLKLAVD